MKEKVYSIARLKAGFSSILADVAQGEEVVVTDHNRPVARLIPVRRLPTLPRCDAAAILADKPFPLKRGAPSSAELVRRLRQD